MDKVEEFVKYNEKMNSSLITDWSREMIIEAIYIFAYEQDKTLLNEEESDIKAKEILLSTIGKDCYSGLLENLVNTPIRYVIKAMKLYAEQDKKSLE